MAIKAFLTADEFQQADEATQALYGGEPKDGRHVLEVEARDGFALENVEGLRSTVQKTRTEKDTLTERAESAERDRDKLKAQLEELGGQDAEKIINQRVDQKVADIRKQSQEAVEQANQKVKDYQNRAVQAEHTRTVSAAVKNAKGILPQGARFIEQVLLEESKASQAEDGAITVTLMDPNHPTQHRLAPDDPSRAMTLAERIQLLAKDENYQMFFEADGASGSSRNPPPPSGNTGQGGSTQGSRESILDLDDPSEMLAQAESLDNRTSRRTGV